MKRIFFIIALFAAIFSASAADFSLKKVLLDPWYLTVDDNEKIYVVQRIYEDSLFVVVTQDDTLYFQEDPELYYHQAFIKNLETGEYQRLNRNNTVVTDILLLSGTVLLILILLQVALHLVRKP